MKRMFLAIICTGGMVLGFAPAPDESPIALVSKVIMDVTRKNEGQDWRIAKRGETLASGERIRTGEKSFAVIKFTDNSMLRVREKSEVVVTGVKNGKTFSKSTELERGVIGFSIKKQRPGEEFRFSSPTSVASIRGTSGQFGAQDSVDLLVVLEGLVRLENKISNRFIDVEGGFTGISSKSGELQLRPSTAEEKLTAELSSRAGDREQKLDIELNDGKGNKKQIEIKFK